MPVISFDDGRLGFEINFCGTREEFREKHPTIARWLGGGDAVFGSAAIGVLTVTTEQLVSDQTYKTITGEELAATPEGRSIIGEELASRIAPPLPGGPGLGDALAEDPKSRDGSWICGTSLDDGEFSIGDDFATREDVIAAGPDQCGGQLVGEFFQTGQLRFQCSVPDFPWDGDSLVDHIADSMSSEWNESCVEHLIDKMQPHLAELDAELRALWTRWTEKHGISIDGYFCDHVESHEITQEMVDKLELEHKEWEAKRDLEAKGK